MRVLHVQETLSPRFGGPVGVVKNLVAAQRKIGLQSELFSTNADYPSGRFCAAGRVFDRATGIDARAFSVQFMPMRVSMGFASALRVGLQKFDLVHIHGLYRFPQTYAAYEARKQGVPYIIRPHGSLDPFLFARSSRSLWLKRLYERWFDLPNLHGASAIHYTTEDERQRATFLNLRAPSFVAPNGLPWEHYATLPGRGIFRQRLGIGDVPLVLFLGRLHVVKGLDLLVSAFERVRKYHRSACLAIVGPDNDGYGEKVRGWVSGSGLSGAVYFVDHLDGADVRQAYVDADVFALPSHTENFGMTVVESLACGTPVVISDQVKIKNDIHAARAGLVTRRDAADIADAINTLLRDAPRRRIMGAAGRALVQRKWIWSVVVRDLLAEYECVIGRKVS